MRQLQLPSHRRGKLDPYPLDLPAQPMGWPARLHHDLLLSPQRPRTACDGSGLRADAEADGVFADAALTDAVWGVGVPADFREYIRAHLAYAGSPYLWPSAAPSNAGV